MNLEGKTMFHKLWYLLRNYVLVLKVFDLFLQGSLLIIILLESNIFLLLRRDANEDYHSVLIEDYTMMGSAGAEFVFGALLAWWGKRRRQFSLAACLAVTSASGLIVLAFPFTKSNFTTVGLCQQEIIIDTTEDSYVSARTAFLILTAVLCGLTKLSIWAHGLTYLDDHDPGSGAYYYGILISIRLSLGLSGTNWLRPSSERDDWWQAHLSICMLTLMFAFLFTLFPSRMASYKELDEKRESDVDTGFSSSLRRVLTNKALIVQTLALACLSTAVFIYVYYDRAYVQARYRVETVRSDPWTSRGLSDVFRALVIIFFVMIFRVHFSGRRPEGVKSNTASRVGGVVAIFVAIFFVVMAVLGCNTGDLNSVQDDIYTQPECSNPCGCTTERFGFSPVCHTSTRTTYFSPCHAGCSIQDNLRGFLMYRNCTCTAPTQPVVVRGSCTLNTMCMLTYNAYQIVYTVMLAVSGASFLMQGMALLRAVRPADKVVAIGASFSLVGLLSFVIGHLIYMLISNRTCMYFANGACLLHSPMLWIACATSACLAVMAAVGSLIASRISAQAQVPATEL